MKTWPVQDTEARLRELLRDAEQAGPQQITIQGQPTAVVLSLADYERLRAPKPPLPDFLRNSPPAGLDLLLLRDRDTGRDEQL